MILIKGKIDAKRVGSFVDPETKVKRDFAALQFIVRDERGGLKLIDVNLPDGADHSPYVEGKQIELAISVSTSKTGKLYFRAILPTAAAAA